MTDPTTPTCARCDRPMRHDTALLCSPCGALLVKQLHQVAAIAGDITLTVAKLAKVTRGGGVSEDLGWWKTGDALEAMPLPPDLDRAERHDRAVNELSGWARLIAEERGTTMPRLWIGHPDRAPKRQHPLFELATWIAVNMDWLRHHPEAPQAWVDLLAACTDLVRVVDTHVRDADLVGLCHCGTARYNNETACSRCSAVDLEHDRAALDAAMNGATVTASEAAVWVANMGIVTDTTKLRKLIWAWADRGHLAAVDDTPRYRFGDVLRRVLDSPALLRAA